MNWASTMWHKKLVPQESACMSRCLNQGEISTIENSFGFLHCINLVRASFLPHVIVLEQEIALQMEIGNVIIGCGQLLLCALEVCLVISQSSLQICQCSFLVRECLGIL